MAADSDGLTAVVTCEGDLRDPCFAPRFQRVLRHLNRLLGDVVKVRKLEPWNSVRVTLSVPREAALRLRRLAGEGSTRLRQLGILSVQVEGDQVISLRIATAGGGGASQEIRLQTAPDGTTASSSSGSNSSSGGHLADNPLSRLLAATPSEPPEKVQFKSPNVVCPPDGVVPPPPTPAATTPTKSPFPFASMNQAIHSGFAQPQAPPPPPPPYPGKHPAAISSPLLVNLLQNEGKEGGSGGGAVKSVGSGGGSGRTAVVNSVVKSRTVVNTKSTNVTSQTCSSTSPSALNHSSSVDLCVGLTHKRENKPNSTTTTATPLPQYPPPPPYSVAVTRQIDTPTPTPAPPIVQTPVLDLTPSLTDDLEHLLPTLERDLARSPVPDLTEVLSREKRRHFLINPLTGEMEEAISSGGESEEADGAEDVFRGMPPSPVVSADEEEQDDEDTSSTFRTDASDSETRSSDGGKGRKRQRAPATAGRESPALKPTEKIKLRLKLEKSEPINSAYKVDVSFIQQPKKATVTPSPTEEPRVPPLHISLRGRHHAFITNKKKKLNPDKVKKKMEAMTAEEEEKKKKKSNHEHSESDLISKLIINSTHYKEKQKERRGSDSELSRANLKFVDSNGIISVEKKRRLSQSESPLDPVEPQVLGSTNVGTIATLPQKPRKDKSKTKDAFKSGKDTLRNKSFSKTLVKSVVLPTGEIDMEAKFKQRLMEGNEKGIPRPPHRTDVVLESGQLEKAEQIKSEPSEPPPPKEPDKCNTPERKQADLGDKQSSRSPNSGGQGEDSGIESMDALSEKSPNQASQSPHADIIMADAVVVNNSKSNKSEAVEEMLDIEAQLAKMEGLNGVDDVEECNKLGQKEVPCELTTALQDSLKQGAVALPAAEQPQATENAMVPLKIKPKEDAVAADPLPVRITPPLYTYSAPDKADSDTLSDEDDDDSAATAPPNNLHPAKTKSLLEQLLIEIPADAQPPSPVAGTGGRSVRTRALSKLNSPDSSLGSPVQKIAGGQRVQSKRKRRESDGSNNGEMGGKKTRKCSENAAELIKACMGVEANNHHHPSHTKPAVRKTAAATVPVTTVVNNSKPQDESSDSDEPLIEKVRKTVATGGGKKVKVKGGGGGGGGIGVSVSTRRSVRGTQPVPNTRSKVDEVVRRKTRSAVSEGENKRKKEIK